MDAQVSYAFHSERKLHPEKFKNQLVNQVYCCNLFLQNYNKFFFNSQNYNYIMYRTEVNNNTTVERKREAYGDTVCLLTTTQRALFI
jgi:hypothetical protein